MAGAEFTLSPKVFDESETFEYTVKWRWQSDDGTITDFPWDEYEVEYDLYDQDGVRVMRLEQVGSPSVPGIEIDVDENWATFRGGMPRPGRYVAKCRAKHIETGAVAVVFEHVVVVSRKGEL